jgi:multiple sugar transport system ATP-binding protein
VVVDAGAFAVPLPPEKADRVGQHIGRPVYFGIRPEDIHDAQYVPTGTNRLAEMDADVTVIENMGSEVYAYISAGGKEFVGRLDPRTSAEPGQPLRIAVDMARTHLFDRETEMSLTS